MTGEFLQIAESLDTPVCLEEVCLTCGDIAVPALVVDLGADQLATVRTGAPAQTEEISVALVDARPGDTVLVHAREAIAVLHWAGTGADDEHS
jgi:hydrogenase expression/formation protein HypC